MAEDKNIKKTRIQKHKNSLDRLRVESRIRILSFKYRGNVALIVDEINEIFPDQGCTLTIAYVKRVLKKFKTEETSNTPFVSAWTFEYLMEGIRQRQIEWEDDVSLYDTHKFKYMSYCCNRLAVMHTFDDAHERTWMCTACTEPCHVRQELNLEIMACIHTARVERRKDDADLAKAVEELGFGKKSGATQNTVVMPTATIKKENTTKRIDSTEVTKEIQGAVENVQELSPMDQAMFAGQIQQTLDDVAAGKTLIEKCEDKDHGKKEKKRDI